jgi:tetratricopeptide (TPR) repeat protein
MSWPTAKSVEDARRLYERSLELDPKNADALIGLALTYVVEVGRDWLMGDAAKQALERADDAVTRALSINPRIASVYEIKSQIIAWSTEDEDYSAAKSFQAIAAAETALAINPNRPGTLAWLGRLYAKAGHPERTAALIEQATRLDPARAGRYQIILGMAQLQMGQNDEAIDAFQRYLLLKPNEVNPWGGLTAAFISAGREVEARRALVKWREVAASQGGYKVDYPPDRDVLYVRVQLALLRLGRWPFSIVLSAAMPREFARALLKFQAEENLPQTGQPDEVTLARLGIAPGASASSK